MYIDGATSLYIQMFLIIPFQITQAELLASVQITRGYARTTSIGNNIMSVLVGIVVFGTLAMLGFGLIIALIMTGE
jgi:hypothetical protein